MTKEDIIKILNSMGFELDYDQWGIEGKEWMRFELKRKELREKDLTLIWWKNDPLIKNFHWVADTLFKAGQKSKICQISTLTDL